MNLLRGFLDNDSAFGRLMMRCWIIIACNVLFVLLTAPVVTIGPAWAAMDYVLLRTLRGDGDLNPLREFWKGFRMNFKQAFPCWMVILLFGGFLALEIYWCGQFGGVFQLFRLGLVMMLSAALILTLYLFPVMAAFQGTIPTLLKHSLYFAFHKQSRSAVSLLRKTSPAKTDTIRGLAGFCFSVSFSICNNSS